MTVRIFLRGGYIALVDDSDYERVRQYNWVVDRGLFYVICSSSKCPPEWRSLHRFVLQAQPDHIIDHKNGTRLDNRRDNLRICTSAENARNRIVNEHPTKSSKYKGVVRISENRWSSGITCDGQYFFLGTFGNEIEAAKTYDIAAIEKFKEFALTNEAMGLFDGILASEKRKEGRASLKATQREFTEARTFALWTPVPEKDQRKNGKVTAFAYRTKGNMIFHFPHGVKPEHQTIVCSSSRKAKLYMGNRPTNRKPTPGRLTVIVP